MLFQSHQSSSVTKIKRLEVPAHWILGFKPSAKKKSGWEKHFPCIVYSYLMIPPTKKVTTMIFEEHVATQEKWHRSYSWQMTSRLGLSEPPCAV